MTPEYRHNGLSPTERIADYLDNRADLMLARADRNPEAPIRASALRVEASNIRAGLIED